MTIDAVQLKRFACPLADVGVLRITGADAVGFLQGQLTNDVAALASGHAQRSGYCSPKGRLLADLILVRDDDGLFVLLDASVAESVRKRLSMYVLRAKVSIRDVSAEWLPIGFVDRTGSDQPDPLVLPDGVAGPESPLQPLAWPAPMQAIAQPVAAVALETLVDQQPPWRRLIVLLPPESAASVARGDSADWPSAPGAWWRTGEVLAGTPRISAAIVDAFVPQMVNLELVGGVDFRKGCFTGQEVVARTQYLGKLKRRMSIGWTLAGAEPGDNVTGADNEPVGVVVASGPGEPAGRAGEHAVLFESRVEALDAPLSVREQPLVPAPLPYLIPVAAPFERPRDL